MVEDLDQDDELRAFLVAESRDVEVQDFLLPEVISGDWNPVVARARRLLDGHRGRVGVHGPFYGFALDTADPDVRQIASRRIVDGVRAAAALSGRDRQAHLVIHSPFTTWDWYNAPTRPASREAKVGRVHDVMRDAVRLAEGEGVVIVIENIEDKDPGARVALARSFGSQAVKVSLDTGHAHYAHRATGAPPVDLYVSAAGADLAHVHLQDGDGYADRHWRIGHGDIPWPAVFDAIARYATQPRLIIEMSQAREILPSVRWLQIEGLVD
ncbi:MAG: sugar phosphate isomerase/epimerase family protein [Hyphomicrobiaceae bacterium]